MPGAPGGGPRTAALQLRRIQGLYRQLIRDDALFTFLDEHYFADQQHTVEQATSRLEGGPNNAIKHLLRHHRGMSDHHARKAVDWLLNSLTQHPHDPWNLVQQQRRTAEESAHQKPSRMSPWARNLMALLLARKKGCGPDLAGRGVPDTPGL